MKPPLASELIVEHGLSFPVGYGADAAAVSEASGADSIDDLDMIRSGGMKQSFNGVYAATTLGQFLREFTHGHTMQLASVLPAHLLNLTRHSELLPGIEQRALIDIDSLLRPVFGHAKQRASFGHTKTAGRQGLRKGFSPLVSKISPATGAPASAGIRLRAGSHYGGVEIFYQ